MNRPHFVHSSVDGHLGCFYLLAIKFFRLLGSWNCNGSLRLEIPTFTLQMRNQGLWGSKFSQEFCPSSLHGSLMELEMESPPPQPPSVFQVVAHPLSVETNLLEKFEKLLSVSQSSFWFCKCFEFFPLPTVIRNG